MSKAKSSKVSKTMGEGVITNNATVNGGNTMDYETISRNYSNYVVKGKATAKVAEKFAEWIRPQLDAMKEANNLYTLQISYSKVVDEFALRSLNKTSARSMDLHAVMAKVLYTIAKEWVEKEGDTVRIPVLKESLGNSVLCTVKGSHHPAGL